MSPPPIVLSSPPPPGFPPPRGGCEEAPLSHPLPPLMPSPGLFFRPRVQPSFYPGARPRAPSSFEAFYLKRSRSSQVEEDWTPADAPPLLRCHASPWCRCGPRCRAVVCRVGESTHFYDFSAILFLLQFRSKASIFPFCPPTFLSFAIHCAVHRSARLGSNFFSPDSS